MELSYCSWLLYIHG
uniref:Uncharacterized protein n=1 Tax=Arundo donax TaxID=35708 RepID=A0A0A9CN38_ARUDO